MIVRSSSVAMFKTCPKKAYYAYVRGLYREGTESIDISFGKLVHDAVDIYHKTGDIRDALSFIDNTQLSSNHKRKTPAAAKALLNYYYKHYRGVKPIESETVLLDGRELAFNIGHHEWRLRVDSIVQWRERLWVGENKTTRKEYILLRPNDQFISYYIAVKLHDSQLSGLVVFCFDVESLTVQPFFLIPSQEECNMWLEETKVLLDTIEHYVETGIFPKNPSACLQYVGRPCPFLCLCQAPANEEYLIEQYFSVDNAAKELAW